MTLVAPRIVNSVSCVTRINHEIHFSWQAQYLVKFECHFSWQAKPRDRGYFSRPPRAFCIEKYNISRSGYHSKFHRIRVAD